MIDPVFGYLITLDLAALLGWAAVHKLRAQREFFEILAAYRLLPGSVVPVAARLLPSAELLSALGLLLPVARRDACLAAAGLLLTYGCAIAVNLARGRRDLDCGCGFTSAPRPTAAWMLARNAAMACAALAAALPWASRTLAALDLVTIIAGAAAGAILYVSIDALLGRIAPAAALARVR